MSLLVTGMAYQLLRAFWLVGADVATRSQLQQMASVAMEKIALDARPSALPGVTAGDGLLALVKLAGLEPNGQQLWDQNVVIYFQRGSQLVRRQVVEPRLASHFPVALRPEVLREFVQPEGGQCLSDCLASLRAGFEGVDGSSKTLLVTFRLRRTVRSGRRCELELSRNFYLRNAP